MKLLSLFLMSIVLLYSQSGFAEWRKVSVPGQPNLIRYLNFTKYLHNVPAAEVQNPNGVHLFELEQIEGHVRIRLAFARGDRANRFRDTFYLQARTGVMGFSEPETALQAGLVNLTYAELMVALERFEEVLVELRRVAGDLPEVTLQFILPQKSNETPVVDGFVFDPYKGPPPGAGGGAASGQSCCVVQ